MNKAGQGCFKASATLSQYETAGFGLNNSRFVMIAWFVRSEHLYQVEVIFALSRDAGLFEGSNGFRGKFFEG